MSGELENSFVPEETSPVSSVMNENTRSDLSSPVLRRSRRLSTSTRPNYNERHESPLKSKSRSSIDRNKELNSSAKKPRQRRSSFMTDSPISTRNKSLLSTTVKEEDDLDNNIEKISTAVIEEVVLDDNNIEEIRTTIKEEDVVDDNNIEKINQPKKTLPITTISKKYTSLPLVKIQKIDNTPKKLSRKVVINALQLSNKSSNFPKTPNPLKSTYITAENNEQFLPEDFENINKTTTTKVELDENLLNLKNEIESIEKSEAYLEIKSKCDLKNILGETNLEESSKSNEAPLNENEEKTSKEQNTRRSRIMQENESISNSKEDQNINKSTNLKEFIPQDVNTLNETDVEEKVVVETNKKGLSRRLSDCKINDTKNDTSLKDNEESNEFNTCELLSLNITKESKKDSENDLSLKKIESDTEEKSTPKMSILNKNMEDHLQLSENDLSPKTIQSKPKNRKSRSLSISKEIQDENNFNIDKSLSFNEETNERKENKSYESNVSNEDTTKNETSLNIHEGCDELSENDLSPKTIQSKSKKRKSRSLSISKEVHDKNIFHSDISLNVNEETNERKENKSYESNVSNEDTTKNETSLNIHEGSDELSENDLSLKIIQSKPKKRKSRSLNTSKDIQDKNIFHSDESLNFNEETNEHSQTNFSILTFENEHEIKPQHHGTIKESKKEKKKKKKEAQKLKKILENKNVSASEKNSNKKFDSNLKVLGGHEARKPLFTKSMENRDNKQKNTTKLSKEGYNEQNLEKKKKIISKSVNFIQEDITPKKTKKKESNKKIIEYPWGTVLEEPNTPEKKNKTSVNESPNMPKTTKNKSQVVKFHGGEFIKQENKNVSIKSKIKAALTAGQEEPPTLLKKRKKNIKEKIKEPNNVLPQPKWKISKKDNSNKTNLKRIRRDDSEENKGTEFYVGLTTKKRKNDYTIPESALQFKKNLLLIDKDKRKKSKNLLSENEKLRINKKF